MDTVELRDRISTQLAPLIADAERSSSLRALELNADVQVINGLLHALDAYAQKYGIVFNSNNGKTEQNGHIEIDTSQIDTSSTDYFFEHEDGEISKPKSERLKNNPGRWPVRDCLLSFKETEEGAGFFYANDGDIRHFLVKQNINSSTTADESTRVLKKSYERLSDAKRDLYKEGLQKGEERMVADDPRVGVGLALLRQAPEYKDKSYEALLAVLVRLNPDGILIPYPPVGRTSKRGAEVKYPNGIIPGAKLNLTSSASKERSEIQYGSFEPLTYETLYPQSVAFIQEVLGKEKTLWRDSSQDQNILFERLYEVNDMGYVIREWVDVMKVLRGNEFLHIVDSQEKDRLRGVAYKGCDVSRKSLLQKIIIAYRDGKVGTTAPRFAECYARLMEHPVLSKLSIYEIVAIGFREMPEETLIDLIEGYGSIQTSVVDQTRGANVVSGADESGPRLDERSDLEDEESVELEIPPVVNEIDRPVIEGEIIRSAVVGFTPDEEIQMEEYRGVLFPSDTRLPIRTDFNSLYREMEEAVMQPYAEARRMAEMGEATERLQALDLEDELANNNHTNGSVTEEIVYESRPVPVDTILKTEPEDPLAAALARFSKTQASTERWDFPAEVGAIDYRLRYEELAWLAIGCLYSNTQTYTSFGYSKPDSLFIKSLKDIRDVWEVNLRVDEREVFLQSLKTKLLAAYKIDRGSQLLFNNSTPDSARIISYIFGNGFPEGFVELLKSVFKAARGYTPKKAVAYNL